MAPVTKARIFAATATVIALIDGWMKAVALQSFPEEGTQPLTPILDFAVHKNPGIAFDIPLPLWLVGIATVIALVLLGFLMAKHYTASPLAATGAWSIALGATNNLIDRLVNGFTTDYLIFFRLSAINLSDILIVTGAIMLLVYSRQQLPT